MGRGPCMGDVFSHLIVSWFWPLWWRVSLSIRVHTTLNHIRFVFYHYIKHNEINLCLYNWKQRLEFESGHAALCKWAACTRQTFLLKPFPLTALICRNRKKNVWKKSNEAYSLSIRVQTTIDHISICFFSSNWGKNGPRWLFTISCPTRAHGIIVTYSIWIYWNRITVKALRNALQSAFVYIYP